MSAWQRLLEVTNASPFTGPWMSVLTALVALIVVVLARRLLPQDDRQQGAAAVVMMSLGLILGVFRLLLAATGAHQSTTGNVVSLLTTFLVSLGVVNAVIFLIFDLAPMLTRLRLPTIVRDLVQVLAFVVILFSSLSKSGMNNFVSLLTTSAVLTAVVGLALQSTIANLFAGIVLHMDRAVGEGDWVQIGTRVGRITHIRWRSTILRTPDGDNLIIPNGQLTAQEVYNFSRPSLRHRAWLRVGFAHRHPPNDVRAMLIAAAKAAPGVLADPPPDSFPIEFTDAAVVYAVRFWVQEFSRQTEVEGEVRTRIWYAAQRAHMEIPHPARLVQIPAEVERPSRDGGEAHRAKRAALLENVTLFAGLEPADREFLAGRMRRVQFAAGEPIIRQGEAGNSLFIIAEGEVVVSLGASGMDQTITILGPGTFFGEMSLVTGEPRSATCSARSDATCYVIDHLAMKSLLTQNPQLAEHLSGLLVSRQATLDRKGGELNARAAQAAEERNRLLTRIKSFFDLR